MAKAEKRISRRIPNNGDTNSDGPPRTSSEIVEVNDGQFEPEYARPSFNNGHDSGIVVRAVPMRSMSLRERRNMDNSPIPRSQSGTPTICWENYSLPHMQHHVQHHVPHQHHYYSSPIEAKHEPQSCSSSSSSSGAQNSRSSRGSLSMRKVPPEVPKRTSSISSRSLENRSHRSNGLTKTTENGSLSSVQSSGSDSSISADRIQCDYHTSSMWKNKASGGHLPEYAEPTLETSLGNISSANSSGYVLERSTEQIAPSTGCKISETVRKRQYRVGLNLFNKKPERGINYLMRKGFLENTPQGVARFLISRKGLSKQMIGEYLGNLQSPFCMAVLECFAMELDLSGMQVDVALRKFQQYYRMPGEAQKIERLMEVFSQRYCQCNVDIVARLRSPDTVSTYNWFHSPNLSGDNAGTD